MQGLQRLGARVAEHTSAPGRIAFEGWTEAIDAPLALGRGDHLHAVVLDELPCVVRAQPSLPSILQAALGPRSPGRKASRARLRGRPPSHGRA